jgi:hypothetical protein
MVSAFLKSDADTGTQTQQTSPAHKEPCSHCLSGMVNRPNGGTPSLSAPFVSKLCGWEIVCSKIHKLLQDEIDQSALDQLHADPADAFQQDAIDRIAMSGIDIWDRSNPNPNAHLF